MDPSNVPFLNNLKVSTVTLAPSHFDHHPMENASSLPTVHRNTYKMKSPSVAISDTSYSKKRGELMKLISSLRSLGAQAELDLPRIVCIGNQSAGKSSLIEAISQIHVPRDSGTCTRCPMECRLSQTEPDDKWFASISLRIEFDNAGNRHRETKILPFGQVIFDPKDVEPALRRAQAAILNWNVRDAHDFVGMSDETLFQTQAAPDQLKFSKNVVCIAISGPKLTDLVFIDLPGLIQNAEENMIRLVESIVTEQIAGNSIILVTIPMSDDLENQKAALLAKKQDPEGLRTIGVLTKPDMLTSGATRSKTAWLDVIEGRKHILRHGYYCTRQPEDSDRSKGITFDKARQVENDFFKQTIPWSNSIQTERFGTQYLTEKLSMLLSEKIDASLPQLQKEVHEALERTNAQLKSLPPPLSRNPSSELLALVTQFCATFEGYVDGKRKYERLVQANYQIYIHFKRAIRSSAPEFRPFETGADDTKMSVDISEIMGDEPLPEGVLLINPPMYLRDIRKHIEKAKTRELPNNIPFPAKVALIEQFTKTWVTPVEECFEEVKNEVYNILKQLIVEHFSRFIYLERQIRALVDTQFEICIANTNNMLMTILKYEQNPFTQNTHYYQVCREKLLAHFKAVRAGYTNTNDDFNSVKIQRINAPMTAESQSSITAAFNAAFSKPDPSKCLLNPAATPAIAPTTSKEGNCLAQSGFGTKPTSTTSTSVGGANAFRFTGGSKQPSALGFTSGLVTTPTPLSPFAVVPAQQQSTLVPTQEAASSLDYSGSPQTGTSDTAKLQNEAIAALAKLGYHVQATDLQKLIPNDPWEDEMTVAAEVRSYYQTSYKRIIDNVPMIIDNTFFRSLSERLLDSLIVGLGPSDPQKAASYLAEDKNIVLKREELLSRKKRLENVQHELYTFGY